MTPRQSATDDSSTEEDDAASQTTEDDPQIPESEHAPLPPAQPHPPPVPPPSAPPNPPPANAQSRARPRYELRHTLSGHTMSISSVKFSPDGTLLASCGALPEPHFHTDACSRDPSQAADNVAKIWSPFSGELIRNLNGHTKGLSDIAWSPDSLYLATASDDHTIRIWGVDSVRTVLEIDNASS